MGQEVASIKTSRSRARKPARVHRPVHLRVDVPLLVVTTLLVVFGVLMVYSASWDVSYRITDPKSYSYMFTRQLTMLGLGLGILVFAALVDYHRWRWLSLVGLLGTIFLLIVVLFVGPSEVSRSLSGGSIQPSELAKFIIVVYLAVWLNSKKEHLSDIHFGLLPFGMIVGSVGGLILLQPDISAGFTIFLLGGIMFFLGGGDLRQFLIVVLFTTVSLFLVVKLYPRGEERFVEFLAGLKDPFQGSDQVVNSLAGLASGGWFGVGLGQSIGKIAYLEVPHTDGVFAVIGEELGLLGTTAVVALFAALLWRGLVIARRAPDELGALLAGGLTFWIVTEAMINILTLIGLMPVAGNPLPFFSIGGSNLVVTLAAIGILFNISRASKNDEERRSAGALVSMRGWDRRRRVSRARRG